MPTPARSEEVGRQQIQISVAVDVTAADRSPTRIDLLRSGEEAAVVEEHAIAVQHVQVTVPIDVHAHARARHLDPRRRRRRPDVDQIAPGRRTEPSHLAEHVGDRVRQVVEQRRQVLHLTVQIEIGDEHVRLVERHRGRLGQLEGERPVEHPAAVVQHHVGRAGQQVQVSVAFPVPQHRGPPGAAVRIVERAIAEQHLAGQVQIQEPVAVHVGEARVLDPALLDIEIGARDREAPIALVPEERDARLERPTDDVGQPVAIPVADQRLERAAVEPVERQLHRPAAAAQVAQHAEGIAGEAVRADRDVRVPVVVQISDVQVS